jgi:hypothetical protein
MKHHFRIGMGPKYMPEGFQFRFYLLGIIKLSVVGNGIFFILPGGSHGLFAALGIYDRQTCVEQRASLMLKYTVSIRPALSHGGKKLTGENIVTVKIDNTCNGAHTHPFPFILQYMQGLKFMHTFCLSTHTEIGDENE